MNVETAKGAYCNWPGGCGEPSYYGLPVPLCLDHGREVQEGAGLIRYRDFLRGKLEPEALAGLTEIPALHPQLYDFQRAVVAWALRKGRAAVFADCGLGKTFIQLEWARAIGGTVLLFAPLCVGGQTARFAKTVNIPAVRQVRQPWDVAPGINIVNYDLVRNFVGLKLDGIVLDESSILKSLDGKTKTILLESFTDIPYRLCCTATPCPNDIAELANHAEFLGVMKRTEMLATYFVHDDEGWRLRGHAREPFYRWLASWSMAFKSPADIGFDGDSFVLPRLEIRDAVVKTAWRRPEELFAGFGLKGIGDRIQVRKVSAAARVEEAAGIANECKGQVVVWCGLDLESHKAAKLIDGAVEMHGTDKPERKTQIIEDFTAGKIRVLVTKAKIAGFGLNLQNAADMIFLGMNDSFETYYQCIRRCWRYGQRKPVTAWIVVSDHERQIVENVRNKERESDSLTRGIIEAMKDYERQELADAQTKESFENIETAEGKGWTLNRGDCVEVMAAMERDSVDLSVYSPPFASLYTYSASERDLGNSANVDQFFEHFGYVIDGLRRVTKPGRNTVCHIAQAPMTLVGDGMIGLRDLRGRAVEEFVKRGWTYHGEVCIDKDPQAQAIRTHAKGLLFVQKERDGSWLRPALADYLLIFRKPGDNAVPVKSELNNEEWIEWARPIWYGIRESDTLNAAEGRDNDDDRHICPLQLGMIERAIRLWSNKGEVVFSPFAGIGSEGFQALKLGRKFVGAELKPRYFEVACKNLKRALAERKQTELF